MMEAVFGFLGVIVGCFIPWIKESIQQRRSRTENAKYLAVRVICILDEYVDKCVEVAQDDGTVMGQAAERENGFDLYIPQVQLPAAPSFPDDVDWKSIDSNLMYQILAFPNAVRSTNDSIRFVANEVASPPDYDDLFEARWEGYANLGLEAIELVELLIARYGLPKKSPNKWNPDWNPKQFLEQKKRDIVDRRAKHSATFISLDNIAENKRAAK